MHVNRLHHVGVVVHDIEAVAAKYESLLGIDCARREDYGPGRVAIAWLPRGNTSIELLQPKVKDDMNAEFLRTHGEGVHHLAIEVTDVYGGLRELHEKGIDTMWPDVRQGAVGLKVTFVNRHDFGGALIELCSEQE